MIKRAVDKRVRAQHEQKPDRDQIATSQTLSREAQAFDEQVSQSREKGDGAGDAPGQTGLEKDVVWMADPIERLVAGHRELIRSDAEPGMVKEALQGIRPDRDTPRRELIDGA